MLNDWHKMADTSNNWTQNGWWNKKITDKITKITDKILKIPNEIKKITESP
jgi:hypothetical protein